jgi:hypothetical protein
MSDFRVSAWTLAARRKSALLAVLGIAVALAGCVTTENALSRSDIDSLKLTGVSVGFTPDAVIRWEEGVRAYATAKGLSEDQIASASNAPEAKAYVQNLLAPRVKAAMEKKLAGQLNGSRPVRLDVVIQSFVVSSAVQRILIGGTHAMIADANLVDTRTGAVVVAYPKLVGNAFAGQGVLGAVAEAAVDSAASRTTFDRIVESYSDRYQAWLLRKTDSPAS